jgi:DNA-binding transcriptional regulator YhcF (GntR family)
VRIEFVEERSRSVRCPCPISETASATAHRACCDSRSTPSEFEMAEQYGVSRDVIRRAKEDLAGEGWLVVLQERGTFIVDPEPGDSD